MFNSTENSRSTATYGTGCQDSYMISPDSTHSPYLNMRDDQPMPSSLASPEFEDMSQTLNGPTHPVDYHLARQASICVPLVSSTEHFHDECSHVDNIENSYCKTDPFSFRCRIPVPWNDSTSEYQLWLMEASFMCRRNERERQRVRSVNDGFSRLRNHLPRGSKPRRQSKVETLRTAIDYIKQLQELLHNKESE